MEYILIIGTFESIFLLLLLSGRKNKLLPDYLLGVRFVLYTISHNTLALSLIRRRSDRLMQRYSKIEDIDLGWLNALTVAALISYSVNVALFVPDLIFHFATYKYLMFLTNSFATVYILFLGYFGIRQGNIFTGNIRGTGISGGNPALKEAGSPVNTTDDTFVKTLLRNREEKQPYPDPDLTISRLSELHNVKIEFLYLIY